jgi:hypothetical protein
MLKSSTGLPMLLMAWEQIMDLIGGIKYVENRPGGRKPDHGRGKSAQKNSRNDVVDEKHASADANHSSTDHDSRLGRKVDTTA